MQRQCLGGSIRKELAEQLERFRSVGVLEARAPITTAALYGIATLWKTGVPRHHSRLARLWRGAVLGCSKYLGSYVQFQGVTPAVGSWLNFLSKELWQS